MDVELRTAVMFSVNVRFRVDFKFCVDVERRHGALGACRVLWLKSPNTVFSARALDSFADAMQRAHKDCKATNMALIKRGLFVLCLFRMWYFPS